MARPTLRTAFCDRIGIEYPVISAGMGPVGGTLRGAVPGSLPGSVLGSVLARH